jgi:hypothetical protein
LGISTMRNKKGIKSQKIKKNEEREVKREN